MAQNTTGLYDAALLGILQNEGQISTFLDAVFGFLYRRTDFYRVMKTKSDSLGFPPGVATKLLLGAHRKYEDIASEDEKRYGKQKMDVTDTTPPPAVKTVEVTTEVEESSLSAATQAVEISNNTKDITKETSKAKDVKNKKDQDPKMQEVHSETSDSKQDDENSEISKQQKVFQDNPESYNGAVRDNYSWSQSITDLDVRIEIPPHIKKGKDIRVDIERKHLAVCYQSADGQWLGVVNGDLTWEVHKEECLWSLVPGEHVHVNLEKVEERWWESIFLDEPKINVRKIDASRPMTDLDDEAQAKIEEMMYNERQKKLGLPQSHEKKVHDVLRQAWDAEGSPFKGQEFDPSKFHVDPNGVVSMNQT